MCAADVRDGVEGAVDDAGDIVRGSGQRRAAVLPTGKGRQLTPTQTASVRSRRRCNSFQCPLEVVFVPGLPQMGPQRCWLRCMSPSIGSSRAEDESNANGGQQAAWTVGKLQRARARAQHLRAFLRCCRRPRRASSRAFLAPKRH